MSDARILVIEDNEQNMYLTTFLLEKHGYAVMQSVNGPEGLKRSQETVPDLILLDIQLPGMDGYEVLRRLRELPRLDAVPIVAITSHAMVGDRERILAAGCSGYIEKPIDPDTFISEVEQHLPGPSNQQRETP